VVRGPRACPGGPAPSLSTTESGSLLRFACTVVRSWCLRASGRHGCSEGSSRLWASAQAQRLVAPRRRGLYARWLGSGPLQGLTTGPARGSAPGCRLRRRLRLGANKYCAHGGLACQARTPFPSPHGFNTINNCFGSSEVKTPNTIVRTVAGQRMNESAALSSLVFRMGEGREPDTGVISQTSVSKEDQKSSYVPSVLSDSSFSSTLLHTPQNGSEFDGGSQPTDLNEESAIKQESEGPGRKSNKLADISHIRLNLNRRLQEARVTISERKAGRFVIFPRNPYKLIWDSLNLLILTYSIFRIFYALAFTLEICEWTPFTILDLVTDCFFLCDCFLNFFTSIEDSESGTQVSDLWTISKRYALGWFPLDLASSMPIDRIVCAMTNFNSSEIRFLKFIRLLKVFRILRILRIATRLEEEFGHLLHSSVRFIKFLCLMMLFTHICSCLWYLTIEWASCQVPEGFEGPYVSCGCGPDQVCEDWNWLIKYAGTRELFELTVQNRSHYLISLYYTVVTLTTLGYGDITPSNDLEFAFSTILSLLGAIMFSFLIGSIGRLLTRSNVIEISIEENTSKLVDFCRFKTMPAAFEKGVRRQICHAMNVAPHFFTDISLLPRATQNRVLDAIANELLSGIPLLVGLDPDCRARLVQVLRPCSFLEGETIFRARDIATDLYWVRSGEVSILDFDDAPRDEGAHGESKAHGSGVSRCTTGELFGEVEVLPPQDVGHFSDNQGLRVCGARARTRCELLELRQADLEGVVRPLMPELYRAIARCGAERAHRVDWAQHDARTARRQERLEADWLERVGLPRRKRTAVAFRWLLDSEPESLGLGPPRDSDGGLSARLAGPPDPADADAEHVMAGGATGRRQAPGGAGPRSRPGPSAGTAAAAYGPGAGIRRNTLSMRRRLRGGATPSASARGAGGAGEAEGIAELRVEVLALRAELGQVLSLLVQNPDRAGRDCRCGDSEGATAGPAGSPARASCLRAPRLDSNEEVRAEVVRGSCRAGLRVGETGAGVARAQRHCGDLAREWTADDSAGAGNAAPGPGSVGGDG
jgi:CRP-like cAMP-binding protein